MDVYNIPKNQWQKTKNKKIPLVHYVKRDKKKKSELSQSTFREVQLTMTKLRK